MEYVPSRSVDVPVVVPLTCTVAPIKAVPVSASVSVPVTFNAREFGTFSEIKLFLG